jgi:hypothetical protein
MRNPPDFPEPRAPQHFIACGWSEETGVEDTELIPITRAGDRVIVTDSDGDEWAAVVCWDRAGDRLLPTSLVLSSTSGKPISGKVMRSLDIRQVIDLARTHEVQRDAETLLRVQELSRRGVRASSDTPNVYGDDRPRTGRRPIYGQEHYEHVARLWLTCDDDHNRSRKVAEALWQEKGRPVPGEGASRSEARSWDSFRVQVRKWIREARARDLITD